MAVVDRIKMEYEQSMLDRISAIEALQTECGMSSHEAEALIEKWDDE